MGFLNSVVAEKFLEILSPTLSFEVGHIARLPFVSVPSSSVASIESIVEGVTADFRGDWNDYETSWDFRRSPLLGEGPGRLDDLARSRWDEAVDAARNAKGLEEINNRYFAELYGLEDEVECEVPLARVSLTQNPYFRYAPTRGVTRTEDEYQELFFQDVARELVSYAVGCMMGRYSLDEPGLILADAGSTIADFDEKVPDARFRADENGIIPITAQRYFVDDIVAQLREFLAVAFGPEHVDANVSWLEHALGRGKRRSVETYFLKNFYTDHVKTYSKRPIYWQISSPKGSFNALIYLHRYTPATLGRVHQEYAEEFLGKLQARIDTIDHALPTAGRAEANRLGKERDELTGQITEVRDWIDDELHPKASAAIALDLDDGVKANYPKLKGVVKKVAGL